jgi:hypothetical protein
MPGACCRMCSVAQFNRLGMALVTGIEQCPTLPSKTIGTNYRKPAQSRAPNRKCSKRLGDGRPATFLVRRARSVPRIAGLRWSRDFYYQCRCQRGFQYLK